MMAASETQLETEEELSNIQDTWNSQLEEAGHQKTGKGLQEKYHRCR